MNVTRNLKSLNNKTGNEIKNQINKMMDNHDKYKNCYFWKNTGNAANRRRQEFSDELIFTLNDVEYKWVQDLSISCRNFYWTSSIYKNGKKSNIKIIQNLI
jgi:hypothetical protein